MVDAVALKATSARVLAAFHGAHAGETILVCGCGPSLNQLAHPGRFTTIGVNDVGRLFDPTYLVVVNPRSQFKGDRFRYVEESNARALFTQLDLGRVRPPVVRFRLGKYGGTEMGTADVLHYSQNSPYVAVCLAAYMGALRIGLLGVDLTEHHFFAPTGRHPLAGRLKEIDAQYGRLAAALAKRGVELVNLSPVSRLTSLPRARMDEENGWTTAPPEPASAAHPAGSVPRTGGGSMRVSIEKRGTSAVGELLEALADTASRLGHQVVRNPGATGNDPRILSVVWNGRTHEARGPTLYCEHGWLPRSDYQISPDGINADSHHAPFAWDGTPLSEAQDAEIDRHLARIKSASYSGYYQYMQAASEPVQGLPPAFLLVPLQIEGDTNIVRHAPAHLRKMQALIDYVSEVNPPWPVIYKQHPADTRHTSRHLQLRARRAEDALWPQSRGNVHQMLKSGGCRGIITINSNVAHDGLLWDVPAIVLGRNIWPSTGRWLPFLTSCPRDWSTLEASAASPEGRACRRAYAHFLMRSQWTLADARDPERVAELFAGAAKRTRALLARLPARNAAKVTQRTLPGAARRTSLPTINVVAENRGWLFEAWKQRFARAEVPGFRVVTSDRPIRQAEAWIFIRAREARATPDFSRTVVQLHDLFDEGMYGGKGERACVSRCAGLSLTHPAQQGVLASAGVDLERRRWILHPVGWAGVAPPRRAAADAPIVAWVGRPAKRGGVDVTRLDWFVEVARSLGDVARVVLVGERLESAAAELRRAGIDCRTEELRRLGALRASEWIGRFDCLVFTGASDAGPWPFFDALHAGVPVVSTPAGWASQLLEDGTCGRIAHDPISLAAAVASVLTEREVWRARGPAIAERVEPYAMTAWVDANLALAVELAQQSARRTA